MQKRNYQKELDRILENLEAGGRRPRLLLHSCCGPCSSYVLEYLSGYFDIVLFYFNPNIDPPEEYEQRAGEQKRLIEDMREKGDLKGPVQFVRGTYLPARFYEAVKGHEMDREGGERCWICFQLRLQEAALAAKEYRCDYFTTTLSISPLKNAEKLNEIGTRIGKENGVEYLVSDFKKRNGYKRSTELSAKYDLYRQDYCGCVFSKRERMKQQKNLVSESAD